VIHSCLTGGKASESVPGLVTQQIGLRHRILNAKEGGTIVSVHRTISTAVLQRFAAACARTALAESVGSEDVSGAAAAIPDVTAAKSRGCVATCDFSGRDTHPQSCPCRHRHRNDGGDYERRASGHVAGVMKPSADADGSGHLKTGGAGIWEKARMESQSWDIPKYVLWYKGGRGGK
jgi:hypothetical protein